MATLRLLERSARSSLHLTAARTFATSASANAEAKQNPFAHLNSRANDTAAEYRRIMKAKPLTPHMTNTTSTIANEFPSVGADKPPADQITSVDPNFVPTDSVPENTERMTGGTQKGRPKKGPNAELDVGEIEGGIFRVDPHRRTGEEVRTMRARLLCSFPRLPLPFLVVLKLLLLFRAELTPHPLRTSLPETSSSRSKKLTALLHRPIPQARHARIRSPPQPLCEPVP